MGASTIVVARGDLSIPGAPDIGNGAVASAAELEAHFFNIVRQCNPDVIVLDLTGAPDNGAATILNIRRRTAVPILVVCGQGDPLMREYCLAGAAECMPAPVDIMQIHLTVQKIIQLSKDTQHLTPTSQSQTQALAFSGMTLHPHENRLVGAGGASIKLTTSENRVLIHFVSNPWTLCTRDALAGVLYGSRRPSSDRAVDVVVTRLRKKMASLGEGAAQNLIKTEFRRGYMFVAEVSIGGPVAARWADPPLQARTA